MPQKSKTPAVTGASRDSFAGLSLSLSLPSPGIARNCSRRGTLCHSKPPRWSLPWHWGAFIMADDYPVGPGSRDGSPETSVDAAASVAGAAKSREKLAAMLIRNRGHYGATADEVAAALEWERYSSRPRLSTMKARGEIVDSGIRRVGISGRRQVAWIVPELLARTGGEA